MDQKDLKEISFSLLDYACHLLLNMPLKVAFNSVLLSDFTPLFCDLTFNVCQNKV